MVNDRVCADIIEQQNCTQKLTELLKSTDEGVGMLIVLLFVSIVQICIRIVSATYAAAILFRLSDEKPYEMKKHYSQDMPSNIYRDEHLMNNV